MPSSLVVPSLFPDVRVPNYTHLVIGQFLAPCENYHLWHPFALPVVATSASDAYSAATCAGMDVFGHDRPLVLHELQLWRPIDLVLPYPPPDVPDHVLHALHNQWLPPTWAGMGWFNYLTAGEIGLMTFMLRYLQSLKSNLTHAALANRKTEEHDLSVAIMAITLFLVPFRIAGSVQGQDMEEGH